MNIGIDMQALQSANSIGGIGKYNTNFLNYMVSMYPQNTYRFFLNSLYRGKLTAPDLLKLENTKSHTINYFPGNDLNPLNRTIQYVQYSLKSLDLLHILSPFEDHQNAVILSHFPVRTVITIYDFIPFLFKDLYLSSALAAKLYNERLAILKSADLILSISEATRRDAMNLFQVPPQKIINIGLAVSDEFYKIDLSNSNTATIVKNKYDIKNNFILTVSNLDHRKNLTGLLQAFISLSAKLLKEYSLVIVCNSEPSYVERNEAINAILKQNPHAKIKFIYSVPTADLNVLYNICSLFCYASLYEGGGLPVIEAMKCGAPVIASDTSSIPEFVGRNDTLFNPKDLNSMIDLITKVLSHDDYRIEISQYGYEHAKEFSWENVVGKTIKAYEQVITL